MVAVMPMTSFGKAGTSGAALLPGQGGAYPYPGISTFELCLCYLGGETSSVIDHHRQTNSNERDHQ